MPTKTYIVENMLSGHCCEKIEKAVNSIGGLQCYVDLDKKTASVSSVGYINDEVIIKAINDAGYSVKEI